MADITKTEVLNILKKVEHPGLNSEFLILNTIRALEFENNKLYLKLSLPATIEKTDKLIEKFEIELKSSLKIKDVKVEIESKSKSKKEDSIIPGVKYTIAVASGKGGVGKSTVAVNLAVALAKLNYKVGLIDADIYGPSIPMMLGINEKPRIYQDQKSMKMIPLENYGVKLMSIGFLIDDNTPVIWRGPMASGALKQFLTDVEWEELDFLLFDMPPGTGDIQLTLGQTIPLSGSVIVTTPQEVSLIDAKKGIKMFEKVNVPCFGIIENMSYFIAPDTQKKYDIFGSGGGEKLSAEMNVPFLGGIPIDPRIRIGGDKGEPIVIGLPDSEHAKQILDIAKKLVEYAEEKSDNSNIDIVI